MYVTSTAYEEDSVVATNEEELVAYLKSLPIERKIDLVSTWYYTDNIRGLVALQSDMLHFFNRCPNTTIDDFYNAVFDEMYNDWEESNDEHMVVMCMYSLGDGIKWID